MDNNTDLNYLLRGHIAGNLSDEDKVQLSQLLDDPASLQEWNGLIARLYEETSGSGSVYGEEDVKKMVQFILNYSRPESPSSSIRFIKTGWFRYAAAILIIIGIGAYLYHYSPNREIAKKVKPAPVQNDVLPGSDKAVLTLSSGKKIELNSNAEQTINDGKLAITNKNGTLAYGNSGVVASNTMSTPKGGQYKLTLPDGTRVWLNAASSITFPTSFPGNTRVVSINGEAYFEVTRNPSKPFKVKTYMDEITVLGTSFNVNSYTDEPGVKTSLLEGSVHINNTVLKPGEAYVNGKIIQTDLDQDLAWKNEVFNFHHVKLTDAMRQIARWYDVDVRYQGRLNDVELGGEIGRNLTLKQVLSGLEDKEVHFNLNGNRLTVTQ